MSKQPNPFLPEGYEQPTGGGGYTKLQIGENRFRIVSKPLPMWIVWENGKVTRLKFNGKDSKPPKPTTTEKDSVKHAWAVIVWNYQTKEIEIWEIDKAGIISDLIKFSDDADWGHPKEYDIKVTKKGSGMDTEYSTVPVPKSPPISEIIEAFTQTPINLDLLLEGKDPFLSNAGSKASTTPAAPAAKVVTKDNWVVGDAVPAGYKEEAGKLVENKLPF